MTVPLLAWAGALALIVVLLVFDFLFHVRDAHSPTLPESAVWSAAYIGVAVAFGFVVWGLGGSEMGVEYFAGYVTEKALSVDNLFVFLVLFTAFRVPAAAQQKVLLVGIVISLVARTGFIFLGATLIDRFAWVFYVFGGVLLVAAGNMLRPESEDTHSGDGFVVRATRKLLHTTDSYDGDAMTTIVDGRRRLTPMVSAMIAIGGTDVLFALDSIPAIFGLTENVFLVFTATAFSLLGLRQLFFLLEGLLDRLIYLGFGLASVLGFIGVKLILHALHHNSLPFVNDGDPVPVAEIPTGWSLVVIVAILVVTVVVSLWSPAGRAQTAVAGARRCATRYLDLGYEADQAVRERTYGRMLASEQAMAGLPDKYVHRFRADDLTTLLDRAHVVHEDRMERIRAGLPLRM
ncbi:TerC/Alx family metal homeostasis membrane protein [Nocardia africana]|uniref:Inner membrane protein alx n=1 Tax=Nocardia africana TaxID=134964 RepID=A0A378WXW2_9NOCA|nr:TerC/Alx family metal homeostasis membrane protein [Nocardia africana]MCC3313479.1 TerC/Alx family metal homeostasis membrane protein [Nocardia africana]SUA45153.1 Inner membrane protein alx [Nocardia africana]